MAPNKVTRQRTLAQIDFPLHTIVVHLQRITTDFRSFFLFQFLWVDFLDFKTRVTSIVKVVQSVLHIDKKLNFIKLNRLGCPSNFTKVQGKFSCLSHRQFHFTHMSSEINDLSYIFRWISLSINLQINSKFVLNIPPPH